MFRISDLGFLLRSKSCMSQDIIKVLLVSAVSFALAVLWTPLLTKWLYQKKMWRKSVRTHAPDGAPTPIFAKLHGTREISVPRMGGLLVWMSVLAVTIGFWLLSQWLTHPFAAKLNFFSRNQTWLPLFTLVAASVLGLFDDLFQVSGKGGYIAGGIRLRHRIFLVALIGLVGGWWFFDRLGFSVLAVPLIGAVEIGWLMVPLFVFVMLATFSGGVVDGLDGLAGGVFATMFSAYGMIALVQNQIDLAALCAAIVGSLLAFLWFNIPPARFYAGETGILGLTATLTVVAFLTGAVLVLPIIGIVLVVESGSVIMQLLSKRLRGKKIFLSTPLHHHLEAIGWPAPKVTMRLWVVSAVAAGVGVALHLFS